MAAATITPAEKKQQEPTLKQILSTLPTDLYELAFALLGLLTSEGFKEENLDAQDQARKKFRQIINRIPAALLYEMIDSEYENDTSTRESFKGLLDTHYETQISKAIRNIKDKLHIDSNLREQARIQNLIDSDTTTKEEKEKLRRELPKITASILRHNTFNKNFKKTTRNLPTDRLISAVHNTFDNIDLPGIEEAKQQVIYRIGKRSEKMQRERQASITRSAGTASRTTLSRYTKRSIAEQLLDVFSAYEDDLPTEAYDRFYDTVVKADEYCAWARKNPATSIEEAKIFAEDIGLIQPEELAEIQTISEIEDRVGKIYSKFRKSLGPIPEQAVEAHTNRIEILREIKEFEKLRRPTENAKLLRLSAILDKVIKHVLISDKKGLPINDLDALLEHIIDLEGLKTQLKRDVTNHVNSYKLRLPPVDLPKLLKRKLPSIPEMVNMYGLRTPAIVALVTYEDIEANEEERIALGISPINDGATSVASFMLQTDPVAYIQPESEESEEDEAPSPKQPATKQDDNTVAESIIEGKPTEEENDDPSEMVDAYDPESDLDKLSDTAQRELMGILNGLEESPIIQAAALWHNLAPLTATAVKDAEKIDAVMKDRFLPIGRSFLENINDIIRREFSRPSRVEDPRAPLRDNARDLLDQIKMVRNSIQDAKSLATPALEENLDAALDPILSANDLLSAVPNILGNQLARPHEEVREAHKIENKYKAQESVIHQAVEEYEEDNNFKGDQYRLSDQQLSEMKAGCYRYFCKVSEIYRIANQISALSGAGTQIGTFKSDIDLLPEESTDILSSLLLEDDRSAAYDRAATTPLNDRDMIMHLASYPTRINARVEQVKGVIWGICTPNGEEVPITKACQEAVVAIKEMPNQVIFGDVAKHYDTAFDGLGVNWLLELLQQQSAQENGVNIGLLNRLYEQAGVPKERA